MKQLGNLAIVCAQRPDILLQIRGNCVAVHVGEGSERAMLCTEWSDDEKISGIIRELNFGVYAMKRRLAYDSDYQ